MKRKTRILLTEVASCGLCPLRCTDHSVVGGTMDKCKKTEGVIHWSAYLLDGEFPKGCPLPILKKKGEI